MPSKSSHDPGRRAWYVLGPCDLLVPCLLAAIPLAAESYWALTAERRPGSGPCGECSRAAEVLGLRPGIGGCSEQIHMTTPEMRAKARRIEVEPKTH